MTSVFWNLLSKNFEQLGLHSAPPTGVACGLSSKGGAELLERSSTKRGGETDVSGREGDERDKGEFGEGECVVESESELYELVSGLMGMGESVLGFESQRTSLASLDN